MGLVYVWAADDEVIGLFSKLLTQHSHAVWGTQSLSALQSRLSIAPPDVCIIDVDRLEVGPDGALTAFCQWRDQEPLLQRVPCLFVISHGRRSGAVGQYLSGRGSTVLEKPLQRDSFLAEVEACSASGRPRQSRSFADGDLPTGRLTESFSSPEFKAALLDGNTHQRVEGRRIGSVLLEREVGRGGMGVVFKGRQASLRRDVAVKMILPQLMGHAEMLKRLQREALAIARLKSKHVVRVFDAGYTSEGVFFIVMEWLEGLDLEQQLLQHGALPLSQALSIIRQIALGLSVAHAEGLIHRDIKPSNIIVTQEGHATLTDFGLAREGNDPRITDAGTVLGTAHYLAPEQITNGAIDHRTDIYALGIVLFELLAGQAPFEDRSAIEVMRQHMQQPLPDLRRMPPFLDASVWTLLEKMTAKAPDRRFASCEEIVQAIDEQSALQARSSSFIQQPVAPSLSSGEGIARGSERVVTASAPGVPMSMSLSASRGFQARLSHIHESGAFRMSHSGVLERASGSFADSASWRDSVPLLSAVIQQLEASVGLGAWEEVVYESRPQSLYVRMAQDAMEAELFAHEQLPALLRMARPVNLGTPAPLGRDVGGPLASLAATAGVEGLLLMSHHGQLQQHQLPPSLGLDPQQLAQRMSPVPHLLATLPFALDGIDCSFAEGRFLIWRFPEQYLFVLGKHQLNKTLLTILVWRHFDQLRRAGLLALSSAATHGSDTPTPAAFDQSGAVTAASMPASVAAQRSAQLSGESLLSTQSIAAIQHEFARYIGPMARTIWSREAKKLGLSRRSIPSHQREAMIKRLADHLDASKRKSFLADISKLPA